MAISVKPDTRANPSQAESHLPRRSAVGGPRDMNDGQTGIRREPNSITSLQHRGSAKQLIKRYESLKIADLSYPAGKPRGSRSIVNPLWFPKQPSLFLTHTREKTAPIRQTFLNLMSNFKKGRPEGKNKTSSPVLFSSVSWPSQASSGAPLEVDRPPFCHSGTLLYLFPSSPSQLALPVWAPCTATLNSDCILLTWSTAQGNPSTHRVSLSSFVDVRSVASHELGPGEKALLPSQGQFKNAKAFEMSFKDRPVEKFAAASVPDRVGWVSAIWDVILILQERRAQAKMSMIESENLLQMPPKDVTQRSLPSDSAHSNALATSLQGCERELPATPDDAVSEMTHPQLLRDSPPSRYASSSSTLTPTHPKSTSILNLKNISLVKTRLAQMERVTPESSRSSGLSSCSTVFNAGSAPPSRHPQRWSSVHSASGADSLVDFYSRTPSPVIRSSRAGFDPPNRGSRLSADAVPPNSKDKSLEISASKDLPDIPPDAALEEERVFSMAQNDSVEDLRRVNCQLEESGNNFAQIHRKPHNSEVQRDHSSRNNDVYRVLRTVEDIKGQLEVQLPDMLKKLGQSPHSCVCEREVASDKQIPNSSGPPLNAITTDHLCVVHEKLDDLLCLLSRRPADEGTSSKTREFAEIVALLKSGQGQHATQIQQQGDAVRYLNELNSWLEAFVDDGNSQIQDLATSVRKLCQAFGSTPSSDDFDRLLRDMQKLLLNTASYTDSVSNLEAGLEGIANLIKLRGFDARSSADEALVRRLDRQWKEQENMMRDFTAEISNEIRDERLRFIDAMKHATTINIQNQVAELRKELVREVSLKVEQGTTNFGNYHIGPGEQQVYPPAGTSRSMVSGQHYVHSASRLQSAASRRMPPPSYRNF